MPDKNTASSPNKNSIENKNIDEDKRDEAVKKRKGLGKIFFEHKYTRRCRNHDYTKPCTYHIILKKHGECRDFGFVTGDPTIKPGDSGCAKIEKNKLGWIIERDIYCWSEWFPFLQVYQHIVMPDHVHILVRVKEETKKKFGYYVNILKKDIQFKWNEKSGEVMPIIFEEDFTDKIIFPSRSLDDIYKYIKHNPHRLAVRKLHPEFFHRIRNIRIGDELWQAYGNAFLLRNPFKEEVIVHRKDTDADWQNLLVSCLENALSGGVAVSAFIAEREKMIRDRLREAEGKLIHIQDLPFGERFKPEKQRFEECCKGNMLILAPMAPLMEDSRRAICLHLNKIAEAVAKGEFFI